MMNPIVDGMLRLLLIVLFSLVFLAAGLFLQFHPVEALPIALFGGCLGWAVAEFNRETKAKRRK